MEFTTFREIPYVRPDLDAWQKKTEKLTLAFREAASFEEADAIFLEKEHYDAVPETMVTVSQIRQNIDTRDAFYEQEQEYLDREMPKLQPAFQAWTQATLDSPFRKQLEEKYGKTTFLNAEISRKTFSPEIIEDLQKENALCTQYSKLIASAQIPFRGEVYTLSQLSPWKQNPDDEIRRAAWEAEGKWFMENAQELDRIYDELVKLRDGMGKKLGYGGYKTLGYYRMTRNCYGEEEIEKFRMAVQKYIVPLAAKLYQAQAERQGKDYPLNYADKDLAFLSGNPRPAGGPQEILDMGTKFYSELSPETKVFWDFMRSHEVLDVESKPGKAGGGYCTILPAFGSPFIFANFNGTSHDVEVVTHEAGHAFECFTNRDRVPSASVWPSMEACEVHSMSMEFFAWPWAEGFFGEDARKFRYTHLAGALKFIPYGTMVDHFQHIVYEYPDFTPEERNQAWYELTQVYMPWVKMGEIPFYGEGRAWQRQIHIYGSPFYYIDYCLAQTVALEFWAMIQKDPKAAFETYMAYTIPGGSMTFTDLLAQAKLDSPFDEETIKAVTQAAKDYLDHYDLTGIE